jgi:cytochrome bd-type quinol oxidase subunit 1
VFVGLYTALAIIDFYLMRRYARLDPPETDGETKEGALLAAPSF